MMKSVVSIAFALSMAVATRKNQYKTYGYYGGSSSSSDDADAHSIRIPKGEYYFCRPAGRLHSRRCLTYFEKEPSSESSESSVSSSVLDGGACGQPDYYFDSSSSEYKEHRRYCFIHASTNYGSKFSLRYVNESTNVFTLTCQSCTNEHHGSAITVSSHHLELPAKHTDPFLVDRAQNVLEDSSSELIDEPTLAEFRAFRYKTLGSKPNKYGIKVKFAGGRGICYKFHKWWRITAFCGKRLKLGTKMRAEKFNLHTKLGGPAIELL